MLSYLFSICSQGLEYWNMMKNAGDFICQMHICDVFQFNPWIQVEILYKLHVCCTFYEAFNILYM